MPRLRSVLLGLLLVGCAIDRSGTGTGSPTDGGSGRDGDVTPTDAGRDAGDDAGPVADSGLDAGPETMDAGPETMDGGMDASLDGGPSDGGVDSGPSDAGPDAWTPDAWTPDAWTPDAWTPPDAGPDAWVMPDAGCSFAPRCIGDVLQVCTMGAPVDTPCPLGCSVAGSAHCMVFVPSNVTPVSIVPMLTDVSVSSDATWNTGVCSALPGTSSMVTQPDGTELCVVLVRDLTVDTGNTLLLRGPRPLAVVASRNVTVDGDIDVSSYASGTVGAGGARPRTGQHPGANGAHVGTYSDGGGGGGGMCGGGGNGGSGGSASGGSGGGTVPGTWELSPLWGGSGGGRGGSGASFGEGGTGGGAVQLSAFGVLRVRGRILAGGGGGRGGADGIPADWNIGAGGGGGSGGAILLEAPTVTINSGGLLRANGGGGGGAAGCSTRGNASPGQDGAVAATRASGGARGPSCTDGSNYGGRGGDGGGGANLAGDPGASNGIGGANGAGGGGGAGCILIRNASGTLPSGLGTSSPTVAPGIRALPARRM